MVGQPQRLFDVLFDQQDGDALLRSVRGHVPAPPAPPCGDRPAEGSSIRITRGLIASAMATARNWRWPPDSAPAFSRCFCASGGNCRNSASSRAGAVRARLAQHQIQILPDRQAAKDVVGLRDIGDAKVAHPVGRRVGDVRRRSARTVPLATGTSPAIALIRVDLPAPFGPMMTVTLAGSRGACDTSLRIGRSGT